MSQQNNVDVSAKEMFTAMMLADEVTYTREKM